MMMVSLKSSLFNDCSIVRVKKHNRISNKWYSLPSTDVAKSVLFLFR
jgi:hypothetical protein